MAMNTPQTTFVLETPKVEFVKYSDDISGSHRRGLFPFERIFVIIHDLYYSIAQPAINNRNYLKFQASFNSYKIESIKKCLVI